MEFQTEVWSGFATAIGIGLLIGTVREKLHSAQTLTAGIRTHALLAVIASAALASALGVSVASTVLSNAASVGLLGLVLMLLAFAAILLWCPLGF
jgi:uncharacterized membrane protein YhiD involved in acid resistance